MRAVYKKTLYKGLGSNYILEVTRILTTLLCIIIDYILYIVL